MKALLIALILLFMCAGCAECPPCPPEEAYTTDVFPFGSFPVRTPKGWFDDKDNWMSQEEWDKLQHNKIEPKITPEEKGDKI